MKAAKLLTFLVFILSLLTVFYYSLSVKTVYAQVPSLRFPCNNTADPEFQSLRPYQASPCGDANKALFCSNALIFTESFNLAGKGNCTETECENCTFTCNPKFHVNRHTLYIELDNSELPILGNTELVKNSQTSDESLDDAQKMNEYVSWYLSGTTDKAESGETDLAKTVDYSGPLKKLLPSIILDAQRIKSIEQASKSTFYFEESNVPEEPSQLVIEPERHNQIVVCASRQILGLFGKMVPHECYEGNDSPAKEKVYRLKDWDSHLPPLPWDPKYSDDEEKYLSDRCEWEGGIYTTVPLINKSFCIDNPLSSNEWADLFPYVPLSSTVDKKGSNYILGDGPTFTPSAGTEIANDQFTGIRNAPLYFAHTQEDKDLSELLNKTYAPLGVESKPVPETTEVNDPAPKMCRTVDIRSNAGDDLFPGDPDEMQVEDVEYDITQATCHERTEIVVLQNKKCDDGSGPPCEIKVHKLTCPAEVSIVLHTGTKSPWAEEIWKTTTADSASTFRKIFPKVEEGAPVSCIANMPTETTVEYDASRSEKPNEGTQEFKVRAPGGGKTESPTLHFPYIGSIYEYFLKGIQTALRPQGYGTPIKDGAMCSRLECGELPDLPKASGSCTLGGISSKVGDIPQSLKDIVEAAAETYQVPANLILAVMYGEGAFNLPPYQKYEWTDENIKNWATCEPMPNCDSGTAADDTFLGFFENTWDNISKNIAPDLIKLDPNRKEPDRCNLIDAVYGAAWDLKDNADGSPEFPSNAQCLGIPLNRASNSPSSCSWNDSQYESAIRVWEFGTDWGQTDLGFYTCATKDDSCLSGGGKDAQCPTDTVTNFDTCPLGNNSHNQCLWDVAHGN